MRNAAERNEEARETGLFFRLAEMSAIVATLLFLPLGALLGLGAWLAFGIAPHAWLTFGETFNGPLGLVAWWAASLLPATIYAAILMQE
jgi:hypothetical protein